jgi:hypothetical protein
LRKGYKIVGYSTVTDYVYSTIDISEYEYLKIKNIAHVASDDPNCASCYLLDNSQLCEIETVLNKEIYMSDCEFFLEGWAEYGPI